MSKFKMAFYTTLALLFLFKIIQSLSSFWQQHAQLDTAGFGTEKEVKIRLGNPYFPLKITS
jgi:hypothetical protein